MERGYWPWRGYAPYRSERTPNEGWRLGHGYNFPNAWAPHVRPSRGGQPTRAPFRQLHNHFPPAPGVGRRLMQESARRALAGAQERQTRHRRSGDLPGRDYAAGGAARSGRSSPWPVSGRDSHATHSVRYVSAGQPRQVELKVPLLQIPKLNQLLPHANKVETSDRMAVSEPPSQVSKAKANTSNAVASKAECAATAPEKPKVSRASVPIAAQASKGMAVSEPSSTVSKAKANPSNVVASKDEHAATAPEKSKVSRASAPIAAQASKGMAVSEPSSKVSKAKANPSNVAASKAEHAATAAKKTKVSSVVSSKPVPVRESQASQPTPPQASEEIAVSEPPTQVFSAKVNPSNAVTRKTDNTARKPKKTEVSSVVSSKPVPVRVSQSSESMAPWASEMAVNPSNAVAGKTDNAATKPQVSSVVSSKPVPVRVPQSNEPMAPQASEEMEVLQPPDQASKVKMSPSNAVARETDHAAAASKKPEASSVVDSKPVPVRVSQASEPVPPQVSEEMNVSDPPHQASKAKAHSSNAAVRNTDNAATKPKKSKVSLVVSSKPVPVNVSEPSESMPPQTSAEMDVSDPPHQASKAKADSSNAAVRNTDNAATKPKKSKVSLVVGSKPVPVKVSEASESMPPQVSEEMDVSDPPHQASKAKADSSNAAVRNTDNAATKVSLVVSSKPVPVKVSEPSESMPPQTSEEMDVSDPPHQASKAKADSSNAAVRNTDNAATKPKVSLVVSSKPVPVKVSEASESMPPQTSEERAVSEPPREAFKAKVDPSNVAAKNTDNVATKSKVSKASESMPPQASNEIEVSEPPCQASKPKADSSNPVAGKTDHAASKEPKVTSVIDSMPNPVIVSQASEPMPLPASGEMEVLELPDQVSKAKVNTLNAMARKTEHAAMMSEKPKVSSVVDSKPISLRVSQASVPIPAHASSPVYRPVPSQKKQSLGDELYEDVSDVPLEEYCDDTSQAEPEVVSDGSGEEPGQAACDKREAAQLADYEDVSDTPLTMYDSSEELCSSVQPGGTAHRKATSQGHGGDGVKKPLSKKKILGSTPALKKAEEKGAKVENASPLQQQAAKPKPKMTTKVTAHLATKQGAAKSTATTTVPDSKPSAAGNGEKRLLKRPGAPCSHQGIKKQKVDTSSAKAKLNPCASTTQRNSSPLPAKKLAPKKLVEKAVTCTKISTKPSAANSNNRDASKDSSTSAPKLAAATKGVVAKDNKSEPTSAKMQHKKETGHSSATMPMQKKYSAKGVCGSKSTSPGKAPMTKRSKSTSPEGAPATKSNKNPPTTCAATKAKGKNNCLPLNGLPTTVGSPNPPAQIVAVPAKRLPQPPRSKAIGQGHALKTNELSSEATATKVCKSSGSSAMPTQCQDVPNAPEPHLRRDELAEKAEGFDSTKSAPVCSSSSDMPPGSGLKQGHASKAKEFSSEATKLRKLFSGSAMPEKRELETNGTPCSVAEGQHHPSQEQTGSAKQQGTAPENRWLDVPKGDQSCDALQASGIQKKTMTKATTKSDTVKVAGIKGDPKNTGAAMKIEGKCDIPSASEVTAEQNRDAGKLRTSGDAAKKQHPASEIADKAGEATTCKEVHSESLKGTTCSSPSQETESTNVPLIDEDATLPSKEQVNEDQVDGSAAASPRDGENLKQAQESSTFSSPSCDAAERAKTDADVPATQDADRTDDICAHSESPQKSTVHTATVANGNSESLEVSKASLQCAGTFTLTSPSKELACGNLSFAQESDSIAGQVYSSKQRRRQSTVPLEPLSSAQTTKQGNTTESPSACENVATQALVAGADSSRKPPPGKEAVNDMNCENTIATEESDCQEKEEFNTSPPQELQGDCPVPTTLSSNSPEREHGACAALFKGVAGACKPDPDAEGPATSNRQDKAIKPSPAKKKSKNKGPGTNTSLRSAWLFTRKKRGKRQRSAEKPAGNSAKKFKTAAPSQDADSVAQGSKVTGEPSANLIAIKKEPVAADGVDTEAQPLSIAPATHCSPKKLSSRARQAYSGREDLKPAGNSAKAAGPSQDADLVAQGSNSKVTGGPTANLIATKKEPVTADDLNTEAKLPAIAPAAHCSPKRLLSSARQAYSGRDPKPAPLPHSPPCKKPMKSPPACKKPSDPSSSSSGARAEMASPLELAQLDMDMFTGLSILDVCDAGTKKLAELKERIQVNSITKGEAVSEVAEAVHKAVVDEYFKRERAIRTLNLLAKIPFSLDPTKVAKIRQLTRAVVQKSQQAPDKP